MKRIFTLVMTTLLTFSLLCACQKAPQKDSALSYDEPTGQLQAGFGRVNITPDYPVTIGGYSGRVSSAYRDYQYVTCIAVSDGIETVLIYTMDLLNANAGNLADEFRSSITTATGIPMDRIFMGATHTHSAGSLTSSSEANKKFKAQVLEAAVEAGEDALRDLAPCELYKAQEELEGMNFVRHYILEDGTYMGSNFNEDSPVPIKQHVTEPDKQMTLLMFDRDDKKDILFVNWQAHPDHAAANGWTTLSADFPGAMRDTLESETDYLVAYYGGASGDVNTFSQIPQINHGLGMTAYGEKLAHLAKGVLEKLEHVEGTTIKAATRKHTFTIDHSWDHMLAQAREIQSINSKQGRDAANAAGLKYGFSSAYHANAVINRFNMGLSEERVIGAFCIGNIGFVEAKCEMFSEPAKYIKENSQFDTTVIICGNSTYLPSAKAYDYHSYEADTSNFVKGTAEELSKDLVDLLNALK